MAGAILRRFGLPTRPGLAVGLAVIGLVGLGAGLGYVRHRWPAALGPLSRWLDRVEPNRQLKLTREGRILIGMTLAVGGAAVNTGNNFLYLVLGLLLALVSVSGVLSEVGLRLVQVRLDDVGRLFAGEPGPLVLRVLNVRTRTSALALEAHPILRPPAWTAVRPAPLHGPGRFLLRVGPGTEERALLHATLPTRGPWAVLGFEVATTYPFGFFRKWKHEVPEPGEPGEVLVFPRPAPVGPLVERIRALRGEQPAGRVGRGDELFSLRPFRDGDDVHLVAWKRSALAGRLVSRENEEPQGRAVTLCLPTGLTRPHPEERARFESSLSTVAGLALGLLSRGDEVGLVAGSRSLPPARGPLARERVLEALARLDQADPPAPLPAGAVAGALVVVRGPGHLPDLPRVDLTLDPVPDGATGGPP
jgi:uncharacterized protein (DUF58 family)